MINIVYLYSTLRRTGPTNQLYYLIKYLDRSRFNPLILTISPEPVNSAYSRFKELNIRMECLNLGRKSIYVGSDEKVYASLKGFHPDVVQSYGFRADMYSIRYLKEIASAKITTVRNDAYYDASLLYGNILGKLFASIYTSNLKKMDFIVSCSAHIRDVLHHIGVESEVIRNGIDANCFPFPRSIEEKEEAKRKLSIDPSKKLILVVGSLESRKNPFLIIDAFKESKLSSNSILSFLGNGPLLKKCRTLSEGECINFYGNVSNVNEYLLAADVLVSASRGEGFPNSVLEALTMGVPVLLSNIKPHEEIRGLFPEYVKMFHSDSRDSLIGALDELDQNPVSMRKEDVINARELLDASKMSAAYQKLYLHLMER